MSPRLEKIHRLLHRAVNSVLEFEKEPEREMGAVLGSIDVLLHVASDWVRAAKENPTHRHEAMWRLQQIARQLLQLTWRSK